MFRALIATLAAGIPTAIAAASAPALLAGPAPALLAGPAPALLAGPAPRTAAPAPQRGRADEERVPPIQEEGEFFILNFAEGQGEEAMTLYQFIKACEQATGMDFVVNDAEAQALQNEPIRLIGTKRIPKREFYSFFQIIMFINNFSCVQVGAGASSVIVITSEQPGAGRVGTNAVKQRSTYVMPEEVDQYIDQPATQIITTIAVGNMNARDLANSIRSLYPDQNYVNLVPGGTNSLIIKGNGSVVAQMARLLAVLDEELSDTELVQPVFEYIPLEFASADEVAELVEQLIEAQREATLALQQNAAGQGAGQAARNNASADVKLVVDRRTNALAVTALPSDMPRVKELIAWFDREVVEPERNYHIYALENVGAEDLAETLETFLEDSQRLTQSTGGTGGRTNQAGVGGSSSGAEEVVVIAEPGTNSLLIAANKTRYAEVLELIKTLDRRADQVLIETALIELTGNDFQDIGVELGLADLPGVGEVGGFGITGFGLSTLEDLDLDGIPDARVPTFSDGLTAGILDGDEFSLPFLVRFLQTRDNANVLSVPSILVNNNGSATISTLDERPFTQVTAFGGAGGGQTQENFQGYQEAGITLTISPSISASRYLRMGVSLEVSNFLGATTVANIPPPRVTRRLDTTINVPDGDTMVIGGVITNNSTSERTQLPWLGELPVLGFLFRREVETMDRRTLYFFVTPHILADEDFADLAQFSYEKKLQASEIIGADRLRTIDPDFGATSDEDALLGFEVPLYSAPPAGEVEGEAVGLDAERRNSLLRDARDAQGAQQAPTAEPETTEEVPVGEQG
jgi:general secretion pathway protein D